MGIKLIAEIGSVHNGSYKKAIKLIELAKSVGADIVKFQMHIAEEETLKNAFNPIYFKDENRYSYFKRTSFNDLEWKKIIDHCKKNKIKFMCSVFSVKSFNKLMKMNVENIKIPSGELTNLPMLEHIAKFKINVFISTGMNNWSEIDQSMKILSKNKKVLMQCTSLYPCPPKKIGINVIEEMIKRYKNINCKIGFSDHSEGIEAAILALSKGAEYIEKHITFSNDMYGSDAKFATEIRDFKYFCNSIKKTKLIIKSKLNKDDLKMFIKTKKIFEKNI